MMTSIFRIAAAFLLLSLAACKNLPLYTPQPGEKTVAVRFIGQAEPSICTGGTSYKLNLVRDKDQYVAELPVDRRVMIFSYQSYQGYQVISTCHAALSLIPQAGRTIVVNSGVVNGKCFVEAVVEDSRTPSGVALDPTVGPPRC